MGAWVCKCMPTPSSLTEAPIKHSKKTRKTLAHDQSRAEHGVLRSSEIVSILGDHQLSAFSRKYGCLLPFFMPASSVRPLDARGMWNENEDVFLFWLVYSFGAGPELIPTGVPNLRLVKQKKAGWCILQHIACDVLTGIGSCRFSDNRVQTEHRRIGMVMPTTTGTPDRNAMHKSTLSYCSGLCMWHTKPHTRVWD